MRTSLMRVLATIGSLVLGFHASADDKGHGSRYEPVFEMTWTAATASIAADYRRAYSSPTPEIALGRWEEFLRKYGEAESLGDITDLTLLRQANYELMRLYYVMGRSEEADVLLRRVDDYATFSVPEPAKARRWCETNEFCK